MIRNSDSDGTTGKSAALAAVGSRPADRRFRRLSIAIAALPVLASLLFAMHDPVAAPLTVTQNRPSLVFNEYLIHYGDDPVDPVPVLTPTFLYRNAGNATVQIGSLIPSCGCVRPQATVTELAPGESGRLVLPIRTTGEKPGVHEYTVTVNYRDPEPRETLLTVKLTLPESAVQIEPKALLLLGQFTGEEEHAVTISDHRSIPLTVDRVTSSSSLFEARITKQTRTEFGSQSMIAIQVTGSLPAGRQRAIIEATTNDPDYPVLQIPILAQSQERAAGDEVMVSPELISLQPGGEKSLTVAMPKSWKFSHIETYPAELQSSFEQQSEEDPNRQRLLIKLSLSFLQSPTLQHGVVSVHANDGQQLISVPVQIVWPISGG